MTHLRGFLFVGLAATLLCGLNAVAMADLGLIETEAVNPNPAANNLHGISVALDGDYLAVGSNYQLDDVNPGTVEIYFRNPGGSLTHQQTLTGFSGTEDFGVDVSLSGDTLAVGAHNGNAAYIYTRSGSTWSLQQTLTGGGRFGTSVSVSGDNLVVGGYKDSTVSAFHREAGVWSLESTIIKSGLLGYGVGLSGDVGISGSWTDNTYTGSVSMFRRAWDAGTSAYVWNEDGTYLASDAAENTHFGYRSDVYADSVFGDVAVVSAKMDDEMGTDAGAAYIFRYDSGTQTWIEQAKLTPDDLADDDTFGSDVAICGNTAIVGSRYDDDNGADNSGSAYIFQWDGLTYDAGKEVWLQVDKLTASDGAAGEMFGEGVAVDGDRFAAGAWGYSYGGADNLIGSAYVYAPSGGALAGDLNSDGFVGGDDLDIVRSFWGQSVNAGDLLSGDPSNDGFVGGDDLDIVRANWGQGTPPAPTAVPEPSLIVLLMAGAGTLLTGSRRGKKV